MFIHVSKHDCSAEERYAAEASQLLVLTDPLMVDLHLTDSALVSMWGRTSVQSFLSLLVLARG